METIKEKENKMLGRKEIVLELASTSNPGLQNSRKMVAEKVKIEEDRVVIKKIASKFGSNNFFIDAYIYNNIAGKNQIEPKIKKKDKTTGSK